MKLEKLTQTGVQNARFVLLFADGTKLTVPPFLVAQYALSTGCELSDSDYESLKAAAKTELTRARAVRILSASDLSEQALEKRLQQKGESEEDAREAVAWLHDLHLLDDRQTATRLVRSAVLKGYGRARIENILYEKRIPREYWEDALSDLPEPEEGIEKFLHQRLDGKPLDEKRVKQTLDALVRRGYHWQQIRSCFSDYRQSRSDSDFDMEAME